MVNDKMVNKSDIFDKVGKRTPYKVPDGYFERSKTSLEQSAVSHQLFVPRKLPHRIWIYGIAASVVLAIGILGIIRMTMPTVEPTAEPLYAQTYDSSTDWSDFADADLFLDNMEW